MSKHDSGTRGRGSHGLSFTLTRPSFSRPVCAPFVSLSCLSETKTSSSREDSSPLFLALARLLTSLLARAADGIAAHATRGPDRLAALADVAADLVRAALGLGEGAGLVLRATGAFEVACFVGPAKKRGLVWCFHRLMRDAE